MRKDIGSRTFISHPLAGVDVILVLTHADWRRSQLDRLALSMVVRGLQIAIYKRMVLVGQFLFHDAFAQHAIPVAWMGPISLAAPISSNGKSCA